MLQHLIFSGQFDGVHLVKRCPGNSKGDTRVDVVDTDVEFDVVGAYTNLDDTRRGICGDDERVEVEVDLDIIGAYTNPDDARRGICSEQ